MPLDIRAAKLAAADLVDLVHLVTKVEGTAARRRWLGGQCTPIISYGRSRRRGTDDRRRYDLHSMRRRAKDCSPPKARHRCSALAKLLAARCSGAQGLQ